MTIFRRRKPTADIDCQDFVEMITDYLEGVVSDDERVRIDQHLTICSGCAAALAQWKAVIDMTGHLGETEVEAVDAATRAELFEAFRQGG